MTVEGETTYSNGERQALEVRDKDLAYALEESGISLQRVPQLQVEVSAGDGVEVYTPDEIAEEEEWLSETFIRREYHVAPHKVRTLRVRGNSMADTISSGDRIRVALWDGETLWVDGVYVIYGEGGLLVKRYEGIDNNQVLLTADNPNIRDRRIEREVWEEEYRVVAWVLEVAQPL